MQDDAIGTLHGEIRDLKNELSDVEAIAIVNLYRQNSISLARPLCDAARSTSGGNADLARRGWAAACVSRNLVLSRPVRVRRSALLRMLPYRVAVNTIARMRPSTGPGPKRPAKAWAARSVAASRPEGSRASISLRSGVPWQ
jgi:hypothetical protein